MVIPLCGLGHTGLLNRCRYSRGPEISARAMKVTPAAVSGGNGSGTSGETVLEEVICIRRARETERHAGIRDRVVSRRAEVTVHQEDRAELC